MTLTSTPTHGRGCPPTAARRHLDRKCQGPAGTNKSFVGHVSRSAAQVGQKGQCVPGLFLACWCGVAPGDHSVVTGGNLSDLPPGPKKVKNELSCVDGPQVRAHRPELRPGWRGAGAVVRHLRGGAPRGSGAGGPLWIGREGGAVGGVCYLRPGAARAHQNNRV